MGSAIRDWDVASYQRISVPHEEWAKSTLERLPLNGDETVLDAGCGTGRLTRMLVESLPSGKVIAVDGSEAMVEKVADVVRPVDEAFVCDLTALELSQPVDAVTSSAVFHWIADHELLFRRMRACLKEGGRLAAQCGGAGNIDDFRSVSGEVAARQPYASHLVGFEEPWYYAGAEETEARLREAGFGEVRCWLQPWEVVPPDPVEFMRTLILAPHLDRLPADLHDRFLDEVLEAVGDPFSLRYVRLNLVAVAAGQGLESRRVSTPRIVVLAGDGIGPEIVDAALELLESLGEFEFDRRLMGGCSIDAHGTALTDEVLEACLASDAVLLGAVGGPKWDTTDSDAPRPEQGLLGLRKGMGLYANLRPVRPSPALVGASPLREERIAGTDLLVVRELTGGIYFGDSGRDGDTAHDTCEYTAEEIERIARTAFEAARRRAESSGRKPKVTSVDKANVMETSRLWREVVGRVAPGYADVHLDHLLVDNAAMQLVSRPADFDVIVTENLFGDILSDESAMLTGSLGMLPSASLGADGAPGLFEPVHGSAPDIAGKGIANPLATFLSVAMMLRHSFGRADDAVRIEAAVDAALERGLRTPDLAGGTVAPPPMSDVPAEVEVGTAEMTTAVLAELSA